MTWLDGLSHQKKHVTTEPEQLLAGGTESTLCHNQPQGGAPVVSPLLQLPYPFQSCKYFEILVLQSGRK